MAKQDPKPPSWKSEMGDGCSGVLDFNAGPACNIHDERYHYGGGVDEKLQADDEFYMNLMALGFPWTWGWAKVRYDGVRKLTYSYPPGHPMRNSIFARVEAFNWEGPGMPSKGGRTV